MATDQQQITLKVFVNKTQNCVVFVESDLDFVDVLLSFLTLPVGTVVRLLNKQSSLGCFDKLYESVEQLDEKYLMTAACRSMLTNPVNSSGVKCQKLRINIDEMGELYKCSNSCHRFSYSYYSGLKCQCGGDINKAVSYDLNRDDVNYEEFHGVFIQGAKFVVTDALCILLVEDLISTLNKCGNGDCNHLEERSVKIEREQVLRILKRSLVSDTPLADVLLQNGEDITPKFSDPSVEKTVEKKAFDKEKKIYKLDMVLTRNKVLYAVASQDFVDLIFSFLTFPLGSLKRHLGSRFQSIGCLNKLYGSAELLRSSGYMVAGCEERLLNPKLAPYFNCKNQVIRLEEEKQVTYYTCYCSCKLSATTFYCQPSNHNGAHTATLIDPKSQPRGTSSSRGSYCQELMYMVTDELVVTPLSLTEVVSFRKEISDPIKMTELSVAEEEVLDFLAVALTSNAALTDAFLARTVGVFTSGAKGVNDTS
ncbi:uncharacterized protein LOC141827871 [Curcuma longa]|uniref:uncharacterized protein LOC141827871 n=1 Tax=Curcuma longa TaxID=136217 RepID=UPI003D9E197E